MNVGELRKLIKEVILIGIISSIEIDEDDGDER